MNDLGNDHQHPYQSQGGDGDIGHGNSLSSHLNNVNQSGRRRASIQELQSAEMLATLSAATTPQPQQNMQPPILAPINPSLLSTSSSPTRSHQQQSTSLHFAPPPPARPVLANQSQQQQSPHLQNPSSTSNLNLSALLQYPSLMDPSSVSSQHTLAHLLNFPPPHPIPEDDDDDDDDDDHRRSGGGGGGNSSSPSASGKGGKRRSTGRRGEAGEPPKKVKRLEENRLAAKKSREKKKEYILMLESRVMQLETHNQLLIAELQRLRQADPHAFDYSSSYNQDQPTIDQDAGQQQQPGPWE